MPSQPSSALPFLNPAALLWSSSLSCTSLYQQLPSQAMFNSVPFWECNTREFGCFCLNLSWISFSNLYKLLICREGAAVLPSNQCCCLACYFHSCPLFFHAPFHQLLLLHCIKQLSCFCLPAHYLFFLLFRQSAPAIPLPVITVFISSKSGFLNTRNRFCRFAIFFLFSIW